MLGKKHTWKKPPSSYGETFPFGYDRIPAKEKAVRVHNHFDGVATRYDFMNSLLSLGIHHLWKRKAVKTLMLEPGATVLDICGGTGDLSILAAKTVGPAGRVCLYDINEKMIAAGKDKGSRTPGGNGITHVLGDAEHLAFPNQCFDAAMVGFGIRNLVHMEEGFKEMYRVLKNGGKMMCLEFSKPTPPFFRWLYDIYSFYIMPFLGKIIAGNRQAYLHLPESIRTFPLPDDLTRILEKIGFKNVSYRKLTNGIAVIHTGER
jgi:demethylmenaquinone methyltransferase/2-methoxy-6-polyprenyl-1,4-benzoquinol methylase